MALMPRIFPNSDELGKKDDDHRPPSRDAPSASWAPAVPRMRKRRFLAAVLSIGVLYIFFKNMPQGLPPLPDRYDRRVPGQRINGIPLKASPQSSYGPPPPPPGMPAPLREKLTEIETQNGPTPGYYYDGPPLFEPLSLSLQGLARNLRFSSHNRNVLFAAANQESASRMIPMACEMSKWNRNVVHFAYMGRDEVPLVDLKNLNGAGSDCDMFWHDARPNLSQFSTNERMGAAVEAALKYFKTFLRPHIYFCDDSAFEEPSFIREYRAQTIMESKALIELPDNAPERLMWLTRLDSGSLSAWHKIYIDIVIQAPSGSSGSLMRLLKSIQNADYFGSRYPHITVEIPADIDAPTLGFLERLTWPPLSSDGSSHSSRLSFRRRISNIPPNPLEASIRMVETFYPTTPRDSHILVLSPEVELSPMYYHYLFFNLLEYRYSTYNTGTIESDSLAGISLITPSTHFDTQAPFHPPPPLSPDAKTTFRKLSPDSAKTTPFMWQAPDATATLYFGNRWLELHSFLSLRISNPTAPTPRIVQPTLPSFAEPLYELMRLRGYTVLYPNLPDHSLAIDYSTRSRPQPEFAPPNPNMPAPPPSDPSANFDPYISMLFPPTYPTTPSAAQKLLASTPLTQILPPPVDLPETSSIPVLDSTGQLVSPKQLVKLALAEAVTFRYMTGNCPEDVSPAVAPGVADDLFCDPDGEPGSGSRPVFPPPGAVEAGIVQGSGNGNVNSKVKTKEELAADAAVGAGTAKSGEEEQSVESEHTPGDAKMPKDPAAAVVATAGEGGGIPGVGGLGSPGAEVTVQLQHGHSDARAQGHGMAHVAGVSTLQKSGGREWDAERGKEVDEEGKRKLEEEFREHLERQGGGAREKAGGKEEASRKDSGLQGVKEVENGEG